MLSSWTQLCTKRAIKYSPININELRRKNAFHHSFHSQSQSPSYTSSSTNPIINEQHISSQLKSILNTIPTKILHQLLKQNRIRIPNENGHENHYTFNKSVLQNKLHRLILKNHSNIRNNHRSRMNTNNFIIYSSQYLSQILLKINEFFNCYQHQINHQLYKMNENNEKVISEITNSEIISETAETETAETLSSNPSLMTLNLISKQLKLYHIRCLFIQKHQPMNIPNKILFYFKNYKNINFWTFFHSNEIQQEIEIQNNIKNQSSDDFPFIDHQNLLQIFNNFINIPRYSMLDYIQYISDLSKINETLDIFLNNHKNENYFVSIHPTRKYTKNIKKKKRNTRNVINIESDSDFDFEDEEEYELIDEPSTHSPLPLTHPSTELLPMSEAKLKKIYNKRLQNIHNMNLSEYGLYGIDINIKIQLMRCLLSHGLYPSLLQSLNIEHNKGLLLYGPPGTGKTMLAKILGNILITDNVYVVNGPEIEDPYIGQTEKNIRKLFAKAEKDYQRYGRYAPLHIIIFDEIDSIAKKRDSSSNSKVSDRSIQQLLSCLDGVHNVQNVLVCGTTNRYQDLDAALLRPGRFGVHIQITLPDGEQRRDIFHCVLGAGVFVDIDVEWLVGLTDGLSQADIMSMITGSRINAIERIVESHFKKCAGDGDDDDGVELYDVLHEQLLNEMRVNSSDMILALDEIRINQVSRDMNAKSNNSHYLSLYI